MHSSTPPRAVSAVFDDPNLVAHAGLVPVMRLAERCGLSDLVTQKVKLTGAANGAGAASDAEISSIVAGMAAGADSIDDLRVLRHGVSAYGLRSNTVQLVGSDDVVGAVFGLGPVCVVGAFRGPFEDLAFDDSGV
ncbi:hypothetical protein ACWD4K_25000 [Streptomyces gelaticus]